MNTTPPTCPVSMWPGVRGPNSYPCGKPCAEGAFFCEKHEADRIRLGGKPNAPR